MANDYSTQWRTNEASGATNWQDNWQSDKYAQQIKADAGGSSKDYDAKFDALTKGQSSVDDEAGWKTVKSLENKHQGTKAEMESLAAEWKSKGYDVRVQDLDQSHGAEWADLAVRKTDAPVQEAAPEPIKQSEALSRAKAYKQAKDESDLEGDTTQMKHGYNPVTGEQGYETADGKGIANRFKDKYQDKLIEQQKEIPVEANSPYQNKLIQQQQKEKPVTTTGGGVSGTLADEAKHGKPLK